METGADEASWDRDPRVAELADRALRFCELTASTLRESGAPTEALASFVPARRILGVIRRPATMRHLDDVWRLGVLLLGSNASGVTLFSLGRSTRAAERGRPGYQSQSLEERRDIAAAALRGGYAAGTPVHFDASELSLNPETLLGLGQNLPLGLTENSTSGELELRVRWAPGAALEHSPSFEHYLKEKVELLLDPPPSST